MEIVYKNKRIEKECAAIVKAPTLRGRKLANRIAEFEAAETLFDLWPPFSGPGRCHELTEGNHGKNCDLSVDLDHPYRLIFRPGDEPFPEKSDGGLDWAGVVKIIIIGLEDTHDGKKK